MKEISGFSFVICIILTISVLEVSCNDKNSSCQTIDNVCSTNEDCCNGNCRRSVFLFSKHCRNPIKLFSIISNIYSYKIEDGKCSYHKNKNTNMAIYQYRSFGVNAQHSTFPAGTIVEVKIKNYTSLVQINNIPLSSNDTDIILELSEDAAQLLGVTDEGTVPCSVQMSLYENSVIVREFWNLLPFIVLFSGLYVYNQFVI